MSVARGREPFKFYFPENEKGNQWDEQVFQECLAHNDRLRLLSYEDTRKDNQSQSIEHMKFAWGLMWKLRGLLGGESRMPSWFKYVYGENPLYAKAWAEIELEQWQKDAGVYKTVNEVLADKVKAERKAFFDPPVEKTLNVDTETGEILGDEGRTFENLGI